MRSVFPAFPYSNGGVLWGDLRQAVPANAAFGRNTAARSQVRQNLFAPLHHKRGRGPVPPPEDESLLVPFITEDTHSVTTLSETIQPPRLISTHSRCAPPRDRLRPSNVGAQKETAEPQMELLFST